MSDGEANVVLAALNLHDEPSDASGIEKTSTIGRFVWIASGQNGQNVALESLKITGYKYLYDLVEGEGREFYGYLTVDGNGDHPFTIRVVDAGRPGEGKDTITLDVGRDLSRAEGGFTYSATAALVTGGFEVLHFGEEEVYSHEH